MTLQDSMWNAKSDRLAKARSDAAFQISMGKHVSAHSIMLSAYISIITGQLGAAKKLYYTLLAVWHATCMFWRRNELSYTQLDVWLQFMLALRLKLGFTAGQPMRMKFYPQLGTLIIDGAHRAIELANKDFAKPHQFALAYMTFAEAKYAIDFRKSIVEEYIGRALCLKYDIGREADRLYGLRQYVRVLRKAGELYLHKQMWDDEGPEAGRYYLKQALALAIGEADTVDQAQKIEALLKHS